MHFALDVLERLVDVFVEPIHGKSLDEKAKMTFCSSGDPMTRFKTMWA